MKTWTKPIVMKDQHLELDLLGNPKVPRLGVSMTKKGPIYVISPPAHLGLQRRHIEVSGDPKRAYQKALRLMKRVIPEGYRSRAMSPRKRQTPALNGLTAEVYHREPDRIVCFKVNDPSPEDRTRIVRFSVVEHGWQKALTMAVNHRLSVIRREYGPLQMPTAADWVVYLDWVYRNHGHRLTDAPLVPAAVSAIQSGSSMMVHAYSWKRSFRPDAYWHVRVTAWLLRKLRAPA